MSFNLFKNVQISLCCKANPRCVSLWFNWNKLFACPIMKLFFRGSRGLYGNCKGGILFKAICNIHIWKHIKSCPMNISDHTSEHAWPSTNTLRALCIRFTENTFHESPGWFAGTWKKICLSYIDTSALCYAIFFLV